MTSMSLALDFGMATSICAVYSSAGGTEFIDKEVNQDPCQPSTVALIEGPQPRFCAGWEAHLSDDAPNVHKVRHLKRMMGQPVEYCKEIDERAELGVLPADAGPTDACPVVIRLTPDWAPSVEQLIGVVLRNLIACFKARCPDDAGRITSFTLSAPVHFGPNQLDILERCAREAAKVVLGRPTFKIIFICEPVAAALASDALVEGEEGDRLLVVDIGGGTTDIVMLELIGGNVRVVAKSGDPELGGCDIDRVVADELIEAVRDVGGDHVAGLVENMSRFNREIAAEKVKLALSSADEAEAVFKVGGGHDDVKVKVFAADLEEWLDNSKLGGHGDSFLGRIERLTQAIFRRHGPPAGARTGKVVMAGGTANIPHVCKRVAEVCDGWDLIADGDANMQLIVAGGAAVYQAVRDRVPLAMDRAGAIYDVVANSLAYLNDDGSGTSLEMLFSHGQPLPCERTVSAATHGLNEVALWLEIVEGSLSQSLKVVDGDRSNARSLGGLYIEVPPSSTPQLVHVLFRLNEEGRLTIRATVGEDKTSETVLKAMIGGESPGSFRASLPVREDMNANGTHLGPGRSEGNGCRRGAGPSESRSTSAESSS